MKKVFLMVGIPGSGKSTWIHEQTKNSSSSKVVSRDTIRKALVGEHVSNEEYFSRETEVFNSFIKEINTALKNNIENIYIDATHISIASRAKILKRLNKKLLSDTELRIVVMSTPYFLCIERNTKRTGFAFVPEKAIERMNRSYSAPSLTEFTSYGFGNIIIQNEKGGCI